MCRVCVFHNLRQTSGLNNMYSSDTDIYWIEKSLVASWASAQVHAWSCPSLSATMGQPWVMQEQFRISETRLQWRPRQLTTNFVFHACWLLSELYELTGKTVQKWKVQNEHQNACHKTHFIVTIGEDTTGNCKKMSSALHLTLPDLVTQKQLSLFWSHKHMEDITGVFFRSKSIDLHDCHTYHSKLQRNSHSQSKTLSTSHSLRTRKGE